MHRLFDKDIELQAMLSIIASPDNIRLKLLNRIQQDHFGYSTVGKIYKTLADIIAKSESLPNFETFFLTPGLPDNSFDLLNTQEAVTSMESADHLVNLLDYYKRIRKLVTFQTKTAEAMTALSDTDALDVDAVMGDMEKTLLDMRKSGVAEAKMCHLGSGFNCQELYDDLISIERSNLTPSTFANFDSKVKGLSKTGLLFVASHSKGGKSMLALNMCINMYIKANKDVLFITLEMPREEVYERLCSNITGIEYRKLVEKRCTAQERMVLKNSWDSFRRHGEKNNCRFTIWSPINFTLQDLRLIVKPMKYNVVCVDYINQIVGFNEKLAKHERLDEAGRQLKQLSQEMNALFIVPAQMNQSKNGEVTDIRYSRALLEHATNMWTWSYGETEMITGIVKISQIATRGSRPFPFNLHFDLDHIKITDDDGTVKEKFEDVVKDEDNGDFD